MFVKRNSFLLLVCIVSLDAQVHKHGAMSQEDGNFNPYITTDSQSTFYLVHVERRQGASNVILRTSSDGLQFSAPVRVNDQPGDATVRNENPPKVVAASNGQIYVCWANERGRWKGNIGFARSLDRGKTFSPAKSINSDWQGNPAGHAFQSMAVDRRGWVYVTWIDERQKASAARGTEIWMSVSKDEGSTFSPNMKILSNVCECCRTNLQIDSAGTLFLSYRTVPQEGPMYRDIILARSTDGGRSFQTNTVSEDQWDVNACPVAGPALVIDKQDRVGVIWFAGGGERPGLYYAISNDHGISFSSRKYLDEDLKLGKHATGDGEFRWKDFAGLG